VGWKKNAAGEPVWRRKVITGQTRYDVQERLKRVLRDQQQGLPVAPDRQTVGQFLDAWLEHVVKPSVRPKTYRTYSDLVKLRIAPAIGSQILFKLSPAHVRTFLNEMLTTVRPSRRKPEPGKATEPGKALSPRTVKHVLVTLRGALESAVKDGLVARNVA